MKILHMIETTEAGGAERVMVDIATRLGGDCESVGLVLGEGWIQDTLSSAGIQTIIHPLRKSFDLGWTRQLSRLVRDYRIDVIHAHEFGMNCYGAVASLLTHVPIVCTAHGKNYYPHRLYRRIAYRMTVLRAVAFVAVSADLRRFLSRTLQVTPERIITIPNGIDVSSYERPLRERRAIRAELGLDEETTAIVTVASLVPNKGHRDLLEAMALAGPKATRWRLLFAGEGPEQAALRREVSRLGLAGRVQFLGFRADIPSVLAAADIFVLPSHSEGLPLSILEAHAAGIPVIATSVGGVGEVVDDGRTGFLVRPQEPANLAGTIEWVLSNREKVKDVAELARREVRANFGLQRMLESYRIVYEGALRGRRNRAINKKSVSAG